MVNMKHAATIYHHLVQVAIERRTTTHHELFALFERKDNQVVEEESFDNITETLNYLSNWFHKLHLPPLTALIVKASGGSEGQLSSGFWQSQGLDHIPPLKASTSRNDIRDLFQRQCWEYYAGLSTRSPYIVELYGRYHHAAIASSPLAYPRLQEVMRDHMDQLNSLKTDATQPRMTFVEVVNNGMITREPLDKLHWMVDWFETNFEFSEDKRSILRCKTDILLSEEELRAKAALTEVAILPIASPPIDFVTRVFSRHLNADSKLGLAITGFTVVGVLNDELRNLPFEVKYTGGHRGWNFEIKATVRNTRDANILDIVVIEITADPQTGQFQSWCNDERIHAITVEVIAEKLEAA